MLSGGQTQKIISHPNFLTLFRVVSAPVIIILMLYPNRLFSFAAAIIFSVAAITDFLDGFLARRYGLVSSFGKVMDPVADKLLVSSSFIMLASLRWVPAWIVCVIIGRELAVSGLRSIAAQKGMDITASRLGKYKTGFQIAAIIPLLIHYQYFTVEFEKIGFVFLYVALVLTVWSGAAYFFKFKSLLKI